MMRKAGFIAGVLALFVMVGWMVMVKSDKLPVPVVQTIELSGRVIDGKPYKWTVPPEALVEEQGKTYVYIIRSAENYWLESTYAYKTEVTTLTRDQVAVAIEFLDSEILTPTPRHVVLKPDPSLPKFQKVKLAGANGRI